MVAQNSISFGAELRRRRIAAGLSLARLGELVHYSKGQLSKVERGIKAPSRELARLSDAVLQAGGSLTTLADPRSSRSESVAGTVDGGEVWVLELRRDGHSRFGSVSRRQAVALGAASMASMGIAAAKPAPDIDQSTLIDAFRSLFDQYRKLGQKTDSSLLIPGLIAQTNTIRELSWHARSRTRQGLLRLGSRYAEYIGWLAQETGNDNGAEWWTRQAVTLATAGGDPHLAAYAKVRNALITLYRDDAGRTIDLAHQARNSPVPPRIRGLAAQREAQGHALAGDYDTCMRLLDLARDLLALRIPDDAAPVIGTTNLSDPTEMARGWCLYELGRPQLAAEIIDAQLSEVPRDARRTHLRYRARQALSLAGAGEVEGACGLAAELLTDAVTIRSATVAADLARLTRALTRHQRNASARTLIPELGRALHTITP